MPKSAKDAPPHAGESTGDAEPVAVQEQSTAKPWGGMSPADAARLRWEKERARKAEADQAPEDATFVRVPIRVGAILRALETKAAAGDSQAARELRTWLAEYPPDDASFDPAALPRELRKRLYARLIAEVEAEDAA